MDILRACVALSLLAFPVPAQKEADARVEPGPKAPKGKVLEWTSAAGKPFWYRIPKGIRQKSPPSLILMLHGTGLPYKWAFWNYPIASGRFRPDDVVVAPEGLTPGNGALNFIQGKKDGEQIAGLIKRFKKALPIGRVYLYGHSQGAFFCYWFAGEYPSLVDGIVAHAGNVLGNVKHPALAKEKIAIGILHGKADAVVPVECAHRTERVYRELGYRKVKKYVVDGLTERSGHWPLPVQVGEMFEWLDQVCASTPEQALAAAEVEIRKTAPDLEVVADAVTRAEGMRKKAADAAAFGKRVKLVRGFLIACEHAERKELRAMPALSARKAAYGAWAARFRRANRAFGGLPEWQESMKAHALRADRQEKQIARALRGLGRPSSRSFRAAARLLQTAYLCSGYEALRNSIEPLLDKPPRGIKAKEVAKLRGLLQQRAAADAEGAQAAAKVTAGVAKAFRADHPEFQPEGR